MQTSERVVLIKGDATKWYSQVVFIMNPKNPDIPVDLVAEAERIILEHKRRNDYGNALAQDARVFRMTPKRTWAGAVPDRRGDMQIGGEGISSGGVLYESARNVRPHLDYPQPAGKHCTHFCLIPPHKASFLQKLIKYIPPITITVALLTILMIITIR